MTPSLQITLESRAEGVVMWLQGRIDIESSPQWRDQLLALLRTDFPPKTIVIDLSAIDYMDTSGIATLLEVLKIATVRGMAMRLQGVQGRLLHLLQATGIGSLFGDTARHRSAVKVS